VMIECRGRIEQLAPGRTIRFTDAAEPSG
jgi:hypothetical protein